MLMTSTSAYAGKRRTVTANVPWVRVPYAAQRRRSGTCSDASWGLCVGSGPGLLRLLLLLLSVLGRLVLLAGLGLDAGGLLLILHSGITSFPVGLRGGDPTASSASAPSMAHGAGAYTYFSITGYFRVFVRQVLQNVGLSNILDSELERRTPVEGPHGKVVGAAVMDGKLLSEVIQRVKAVGGIEALLILPVAALHLAVVAGRIGANELVADTQLSGSGLKEGGQIPPAVGETVGEFQAVVGLDALHPDAPAGIPFEQPSEEIGRGIGGLLRVGGQKTQAGELVNGGVLV